MEMVYSHSVGRVWVGMEVESKGVGRLGVALVGCGSLSQICVALVHGSGGTQSRI